MVKKILFLTGTRADFGKLKSLISTVEQHDNFETYIFVTGMHMFPKYGSTGNEVEKAGFKNLYFFVNQKPQDSMDTILANTIHGLGNYLDLIKPDMLIIHGDRVEALAGASVGALNNIIVGHIEGGEVSGAIDESIRHSVSKLAHIHFVANEEAKMRLIQMGELEPNIHVIGSPDIDLMLSSDLPSLGEVKEYYEIPFKKYSILIYHPVTTNLHSLLNDIREIIKAIMESGQNYVVIYPNNDSGVDIILEEYEQLKENPHFRVFPSLRFEYFLVLLKNCEFIIGNSSAGVREAPIYGRPSINIGNRQNNRFSYESILNVKRSAEEITKSIEEVKNITSCKSYHFGDGKSAESFMEIMERPETWKINTQKYFIDMGYDKRTIQESIERD
jgi:UDP-N-acetylglucosamine 2-epimerase (hydrolysing)